MDHKLSKNRGGRVDTTVNVFNLGHVSASFIKFQNNEVQIKLLYPDYVTSVRLEL